MQKENFIFILLKCSLFSYYKNSRNARYSIDKFVNSCYLHCIIRCKSLFFVKGGKFPNGHVSGNKAMRERGIGCAQSQDREAQKKTPFLH